MKSESALGTLSLLSVLFLTLARGDSAYSPCEQEIRKATEICLKNEPAAIRDLRERVEYHNPKKDKGAEDNVNDRPKRPHSELLDKINEASVKDNEVKSTVPETEKGFFSGLFS